MSENTEGKPAWVPAWVVGGDIFALAPGGIVYCQKDAEGEFVEMKDIDEIEKIRATVPKPKR